MNYKIEKTLYKNANHPNSMHEKMCAEVYPSLYRDETALRLVNAAGLQFFGASEKIPQTHAAVWLLEVAMRQNDLAFEVREYLKSHPHAAVVNLGCGLDSTGRACDNGKCKLYNLDFPDVIAVRNELLPARDREEKHPPATSTIHRGLRESTPPAVRSSLLRECSTIS